MKRFFAIFKKEFRHIRRDPLSLGVLIFIPALLLVLYGYALSFDVKHIRTAALDYSRTPASRLLLDSLFQNPYFDRVAMLNTLAEADAWLTTGRARVVLVVPRDYADRLARGETARLQALVDGADANTATATVGYLDALADRMTRQVQIEVLRRAGRPADLPSVRLEPRIWFNPDLESARFLIPGLIGMLLMLAAVVATSLSIVREKERQTIEQMMVSPIRPEELILGKTLPYIIICLLTMLLILAAGYLLFGIVIRGSLLLLALATLCFLFAALGMGILISSITRSQQVAFQIAVIASLLPSIVLSGLIFPIQNMPPPVQVVTLLVVPRYFITALRGIILKDAAFSMIWPQLAAMLALGLFFNLLAARMTRKAV
jgi:ABC-2 type transport system permease protein